MTRVPFVLKLGSRCPCQSGRRGSRQSKFKPDLQCARFGHRMNGHASGERRFRGQVRRLPVAPPTSVNEIKLIAPKALAMKAPARRRPPFL
jgi:hypothetical protein